MTEHKYTFDALFSDAGPFDEPSVIKAVFPFVTIQKSTNDIFFKETYPLTNTEKILVYALAKKLLKTRSLIETEMITAVEVYKKTGIKRGSVDPIFKDLKKDGFLVGKIEYEVPVTKISQIINLISHHTNNHE